VLADAMTGSALISRIRSLPDARGDTPIVAVTAFDQLSRRIELFQLGINDYVAKPIVADELISRLRNLVERRNAERVIKQHGCSMADI
jgi:DNA-binding response OmpR family regulator